MPPLRPHARLATHEVTNQPPPFEDVNLFETDAALKEALAREGGESHESRLSAFGARCGAAETREASALANGSPPQLKSFDRYGHRLDEVDFHPAYHQLMALGLEAGYASVAWTAKEAGHVAHAAIGHLMYQADGGVCCPMTMTYAVIPALAHAPDIAKAWSPGLTSGKYDPRFIPYTEKAGLTMGMAMTEKQGGSDVRANTTRAAPAGDGAYELVGHKWFCSAPMSDAFLTLAYAEGGLSCFFVPRWRADGTRNAIHVMRLKDKLGDKSNASSEIEYHGAVARLVGEEGRGVATIIEMVNHTRLDCMVGSAGLMRDCVARALWHAEHRTAFQKKLIDQPAMRAVLADLAVESEAATALAFRLARAFDRASTDEQEGLFARLATPVGKYWLTKRSPGVAYEAMEVHGGAGYVEEGGLARIYRQAPLNAIWEGSGNVIALDALRALARTPAAGEAIIAELDAARGAHASLDATIDRVQQALANPGALSEGSARGFVETLALALQGALLATSAPDFVADAFCALRLDQPSLMYGASGAAIDEAALLARAAPR